MNAKDNDNRKNPKESKKVDVNPIFCSAFSHFTLRFHLSTRKEITKMLSLLLCITVIPHTVCADQVRDPGQELETAGIKSQIGGFPVVLYSDETRIAAGGGAQVMFGGPGDRFSSSLGLMGFYTQNRQYTFILAPEFYLSNDSYKMTGNFGYSYFPDTFYGIGNDTSKDTEEKYTGRLCKINPILQKNIIPSLFVGIHYDYAYGKVSGAAKNGQLARGSVPGSEGGGASGAGITATWDTRDNNLYPLSGSFHQFSASTYGSFLGSDYSFNSYLIDLRQYYRMSDTHVLAFQGVTCINTGSPSFQYMNDVSSLGKYLRGYTQTQFVDKNVLAFQAEYRMPLYGRFGVVAFAGCGQVSGKIEEMTFRDFKPSGGLGVRFALIPEQKVNLRIDMGIGKDTGSFDVSLMEMF